MFQVFWTQRALNDLAEIWAEGDSSLRQEITLSAHAIESMLQLNPFEGSESREGADRVVFVAPLGVLFEVDQDSQFVRVEHVWRVRSRRNRQ